MEVAEPKKVNAEKVANFFSQASVKIKNKNSSTFE